MIVSIYKVAIFWFIVHGNNADFLIEEEYSMFKASSNYEARIHLDRSQQDRFIVSASGMPDHPWGRVNQNTPMVQNYTIPIPKEPKQAQIPGCVPMGIIGLARTGVALYNPLDAMSENAVEGPGAEVFDSCDGHADPNSRYHYHKLPESCLYKNEVDEFIGIALDGYPIYGPNVSAGLIMHGNLSEGGLVTSAHLDKCHGTTVNGKYRYYMTYEFPYIMGCYRGDTIHYGEAASRITYNCINETSNWNYYLCNCQTGGQGNQGMRPECAQNNPNRPSDCPEPPDCSPDNPNRPAECNMLCSPNNRRRPTSCDSTRMPDSSTVSTISRPVGGPIDGAGSLVPKTFAICTALIFQITILKVAV